MRWQIPGHVKSRQVLMQESKILWMAALLPPTSSGSGKICPADGAFDCIETVYGMGYRWNVETALSEVCLSAQSLRLSPVASPCLLP